MGLVDDDGVVLFQEAVVLGLGQQDAVGHQLDQAGVAGMVLEAHLVADQLAQRRADLLGHAGRHAARGQAARLGVADQAVHTTAQLQADLRQLGGLTRAGLASDHQHLVFFQRGLDLVALGGDRQGVVVADRRDALPACLDLGHRGLEALQPLRQLGLVLRRLLLQFVQLAAQAVAVGLHGLVEVLLQGVEVGHCNAAVWRGRAAIVADCTARRETARLSVRLAAGRRAACRAGRTAGFARLHPTPPAGAACWPRATP